MAVIMYVILTHVLFLTLGYHAKCGLALKNENVAIPTGKTEFEREDRHEHVDRVNSIRRTKPIDGNLAATQRSHAHHQSDEGEEFSVPVLVTQRPLLI